MSADSSGNPQETHDQSATNREASRLLVKNTSFLMAGQIAIMPISILIAGLLGRFLGPEDFGTIYLATTFNSLAFLLTDWGQGGALMEVVARDRTRAAEFIGTGRMMKIALGPIACGLSTGIAYLSDQSPRLQTAVLIVSLAHWFQSLHQTYINGFRSFERSALPALSQVLHQLLTALFTATVLFAGGSLYQVLFAQATSSLVILVFLSRNLRRLDVGKLYFSWSAARELLGRGTPHLVLGITMALQPNIDAFFLSRAASPAAAGWHAAANKLIGTLALPVTTLCSALHPTLVRLSHTDRSAYLATAGNALGTILLVVAPAAIGAAMYPDLGIQLFNKETFHEAEDNLRLLSVFLVLAYVTMTSGTTAIAGGKQKIWSVAQFGCVAVSAALDPFLVPYFETHYGNGGLGVCISVIVGELVILGFAVVLLPEILLGRAVLRMAGATAIGGLVMALTAHFTRMVMNPWLSAPLAVLAYAAALWKMGLLTPERLRGLKAMFSKKAAS